MRYRCGKCPVCDPKLFEFWFPSRKKRRTHDEVVLEKRNKMFAVAARKEFHRRRKGA